MTNLNLDDDESSSDNFYKSYMSSDGELKVGDCLRTKEDCVRAIKKFHMQNSADYTIHRTDARRYIILCCNVPCTFWLATSYRKKRDL